jgi:hypothetical protein
MHSPAPNNPGAASAPSPFTDYMNELNSCRRRPSTLSLMETRPSALSLHVLVRITPSASVVAQHRRVARQRRRPWRTSTRAGPRPPRRPSPPPRECSGRPNDNSCVASCVASSRARQISIPYHPPTNLAFVPFVLLRRPPRITAST